MCVKTVQQRKPFPKPWGICNNFVFVVWATVFSPFLVLVTQSSKFYGGLYFYKPHKLCRYSPEPRIEDCYFGLNFIRQIWSILSFIFTLHVHWSAN